MLEKIFSLIPLIAELFEGLKIEVCSFRFRNSTPSNTDVLIRLSVHPVAYWAELNISNSSQKYLGIKKVVLSVNSDKFMLDEGCLPKVFSPGECRRVSWPFECAEPAPTAGEFKLIITDSRGRNLSVKSEFPVVDKRAA